VRAVEQVLLESLLLLDRRKYAVIVVLGQYTIAVIIQDGHAFDGVQRGFLQNGTIIT